MKKYFSISFLAIAFAALFSGCVKDKFDEPPTGGKDPDGVVANATIAEIKSMYAIGSNVPVQITTDKVIMGVINADDKDGNFYKVLTIQDSTGGIQIKVDATNTYLDYPIGRRVFVKLNGMYIGEYNALYQIGATVDYSSGRAELTGIPSALLPERVLKGVYGINIAPKVVSIGTLKSNISQYQNTLIQLDEVEFDKIDTGATMADALTGSSVNHTIKDCFGTSVTMRTSGYANFANTKVPSGHGKLIAVASQYGTSATAPQIYVRNMSDMQFDGDRCGSSTTGGIAGLRTAYFAGTTTIPAGTVIHAVVVSDRTYGNFDPKNIAVQDANGGINIRFSSNHTYSVGDSVDIAVGGLSVSAFSGLLQISSVPFSNVTLVSSGNSIAPITLTAAQLASGGAMYESRLVKIDNCTLPNTTFYSGSSSGFNLTFSDATGTFPHRTLSSATFINDVCPQGSKSVTAIVGNFNGTYQVSIRSLADVQ